jgi:hypothetical protein
MNNYVYQIAGALESAHGKLQGFRVMVCNVLYFDTVDVPSSVLDKETIKFLEFRLKLTKDALDIQKLPYKIQRAIREPLGHFLDDWVLKNFYGDTIKSKSTNS